MPVVVAVAVVAVVVMVVAGLSKHQGVFIRIIGSLECKSRRVECKA